MIELAFLNQKVISPPQWRVELTPHDRKALEAAGRSDLIEEAEKLRNSSDEAQGILDQIEKIVNA